jgi:hypothetical protein
MTDNKEATWAYTWIVGSTTKQKPKEAHVMTRVSQSSNFENEPDAAIGAFFKSFKVLSHLRAAGAYKQSGIPVITVFMKLFSLAFSSRTLFMSLRNGSSNIGKDTFYRFVNSCRINWFKFTTALSVSVINRLFREATGEDRVNMFIVDDTLYSRGRSKKAELLSWVHDHTQRKSVRGFRLLTLAVCWIQVSASKFYKVL